MNSDITIVTAFFSLNRGEWDNFSRSNEKYFEYFKFWCGVKNDLIIYTNQESVEEIKKIREKKGQFNTKFVILDDWKSYDKELYNSILKTLEFDSVKEFRLYPNNPESKNAEYNYLMLLKEWCIKDAVEKKYAKGMIAWVDFGFNHGGDFYINEAEFDFCWNYEFSNKIHLFKVNDLDNLPTYEICRRMSTYIQGDMIVAPDYLWEELWNLVRENMLSLNKAGLVDDDQTILLMAYREKPELFEIHETKWFSIFKDFGVPNLSTKKLIPTKSFKRKVNYYIVCLIYSFRWFKRIYKEGTKE